MKTIPTSAIILISLVIIFIAKYDEIVHSKFFAEQGKQISQTVAPNILKEPAKKDVKQEFTKEQNELDNFEPDFGPYMRSMQRAIKENWNPPKGYESKRVVVLFKIAKDGRLLSCQIFQSSGLPIADMAALEAIKKTAPFRPLPAGFKGNHIDIEFSFDYNVHGAKPLEN